MVYKMDSRIKFHEIDENQYLDLPSLIDLMQDCGNLHGEDCGATIDYQYEIAKQTWVIVSWQIKINEMPKLGDYVTTSTWGYKYRQVMAGRNFTVDSPDGKNYIKADSQWVMINVDTQKPEKIRDEIIEMYTVEPDKKLPDEFPGRVIRLAAGGEEREPIEVSGYMLDANHHVNNAVFVRVASRFLPKDFKFNRFGAQYAEQAHQGEIMIPRIAKLETGWQIALLRENGKPYFVSQWEMKND